MARTMATPTTFARQQNTSLNFHRGLALASLIFVLVGYYIINYNKKDEHGRPVDTTGALVFIAIASAYTYYTWNTGYFLYN